MDDALEEAGRTFHDELDPDQMLAGFAVKVNFDDPAINRDLVERLESYREHPTSRRHLGHQDRDSTSADVDQLAFLTMRPVVLLPCHVRFGVDSR